MECALCEKRIEKYEPAFNHLRLDEQRAVDICQGCIDAFVTWQGAKLASLFPTKTLKKAYGKRQADSPSAAIVRNTVTRRRHRGSSHSSPL